VIAELAASSGWASVMMQYVPTEEEEAQNATVSVWIALSRNPDSLRRLIELSGPDANAWQSLPVRVGFAGWTDDHASILPILNFDSLLPGGSR
jgi:hypothetical protein